MTRFFEAVLSMLRRWGSAIQPRLSSQTAGRGERHPPHRCREGNSGNRKRLMGKRARFPLRDRRLIRYMATAAILIRCGIVAGAANTVNAVKKLRVSTRNYVFSAMLAESLQISPER